MDDQAAVQLPLYKCHKQVHAAKIEEIESGPGQYRLGFTAIQAFKLVGAPWFDKHKPEVGGYYVVCADGYESYSPGAAFEEGYTLKSGPPARTTPRLRDSTEVEGAISQMEAECLAKTGEVSVGEARQIAHRYNASHFRNHGDVGEEARYTIPVDFQRDDDVRLHAFISRASLAFGELAKLKANTTELREAEKPNIDPLVKSLANKLAFAAPELQGQHILDYTDAVLALVIPHVRAEALREAAGYREQGIGYGMYEGDGSGEALTTSGNAFEQKSAPATSGATTITDQQAYAFLLALSKLDEEEDAGAPPTFEDFVAEAAEGLPVFKAVLGDALKALGFTAGVAAPDAGKTVGGDDHQRAEMRRTMAENNRIIRLLHKHGVYSEALGEDVHNGVDPERDPQALGIPVDG